METIPIIESLLIGVCISNAFMFVIMVLLGREYVKIWQKYADSEKSYIALLFKVGVVLEAHIEEIKKDNED